MSEDIINSEDRDSSDYSQQTKFETDDWVSHSDFDLNKSDMFVNDVRSDSLSDSVGNVNIYSDSSGLRGPGFGVGHFVKSDDFFATLLVVLLALIIGAEYYFDVYFRAWTWIAKLILLLGSFVYFKFVKNYDLSYRFLSFSFLSLIGTVLFFLYPTPNSVFYFLFLILTLLPLFYIGFSGDFKELTVTKYIRLLFLLFLFLLIVNLFFMSAASFTGSDLFVFLSSSSVSNSKMKLFLSSFIKSKDPNVLPMGTRLIIFFKGLITGVQENMVRVGNNIEVASKTYIAKLRGQPIYEADMEKSSRDSSLGVTIENLHTRDKSYLEGEDILLWADLKAKTLISDDFSPLMVYTGCTLKKGLTPVSDVKISVEPKSVEIYGEGEEFMQCTYSNVPAGKYKLVMTSSFDFETFTYAPYTFVLKDYANALKKSGKDINLELGIKKELKPIFTQGPVKLGMAAKTQPIQVNFNDKSVYDFSFGVTISNLNPKKGKVSYVDYVIMQVPDWVTLTRCDVNGVELLYGDEKAQNCVEGTNCYRLSDNSLTRKNDGFNSVTCIAEISKGDFYDALGASNSITETMVSMVKYKYTYEASTPLVVKAFKVNK